MPVGGNFTSCNCGPDSQPCASPTEPAATVGLCLPDGTPIAAVITRDCAGTVLTEGWIDLTTGVFTPGPVPADAGACAPDCADTICVLRCDDTDGDGQPDATYNDLWCVYADGTAELILTYQGDPSQPYTPISPVECTHGTVTTEAVPLCDHQPDGTTVPFLRRYTFVSDGTASYVDVTLDGQTSYVVTGTVGPCASAGQDPVPEPCDEPTTPTATVGLCLADGTPIAVVVTRDCDGTVTQDGWLSLTTGAWSTGVPPAGTVACGDTRSIQVSGTFCDVDEAAGDVLGLVLVEYSYAADGSIAAVRLVDAVTGQTYTPTGSITVCPAGADEQVRDQDLIELCDTDAATGAVTPFVRDYRRDETGTITGHSDYTLDGVPYTPTGTVGSCTPPEPEPDPCRDTSAELLCDVAALDTLTVLDTINRTDADGWQITSYTLGGCTGYQPPDGPVPGAPVWSAPGYLGARADRNLGIGSCSGGWSGYDTALIRWTLTKTFTAPEDGVAVVTADNLVADGGARVRVNGQDVGLYTQWNQPAVGGSSQVPVTAGPNVIEVEVRDVGGPNYLRGRLDVVMTRTQQFRRTIVTDCETGTIVSTTDTTLDGQPYEVTGTVGQCQPVAECCPQPPPEQRLDVETGVLCVVDDDSGEVLTRVLAEWLYDDQTGERTEQRLVDLATGEPVELPAGASLTTCPMPDRIVVYEAEPVILCDTAADGAITQFLRHIGYADGVATGTTDTLLDGVTAYEVTGEVGVCSGSASEPCRDTTTQLLCDVPTDGVPAPTVTDTDPAPFYPYPEGLPATGAQTLWDGGTLNLPAGTGPQPGTIGAVNILAATITAPRPACDDGTAHVTVGVDITQLGPDAGCGSTGHLRLFNGTAQIALTVLPAGTPVGWAGTVTVEADVPAADLAAGSIAAVLALDAYDGSTTCTDVPRETGWTLANFTTDVVYAQTGCVQRFFRVLTVNCDGTVVNVSDTTLDGQPYTVVGEPGECVPVGGDSGCCPTSDVEPIVLCDVAADGTTTRFLRTYAYPGTGGAPTAVDTLLDGTTPYTVAGTVDVCPPGPCRDAEVMTLCDTVSGSGTGQVPAVDTTPAALAAGDGEVGPLATIYDPLPGGAQPLWDGEPFPWPGEDPGQWEADDEVTRFVTADLLAGIPACDGQVTVALSAEVALDAGLQPVTGGAMVLRHRGVPIASTSLPSPAPPGTAQTLSVSATVGAADLADPLNVLIELPTWQGNEAKSWTVEGFTATYTFTPAAGECRTEFVRRFVFDCATGELISTSDTTLDGQPYTPAGTVGLCGGGQECATTAVLEACRCDDTTGDGTPDTEYVELMSVGCDGTLSSIGSYLPDLSAPYTPVAPVPCGDAALGGAPAVTGVQARRVELAPGATWDASAWPTLQSVTALAHTGTGVIATADGPSTLHAGESVTWSLARSEDAHLTGPLTITCDTGTVTIAYTLGVTL